MQIVAALLAGLCIACCGHLVLSLCLNPVMSPRRRMAWRQRMTRAGLPLSMREQDMLSLVLLSGGLALLWLRQRTIRRQRRIERDVPFMLDLMTLCVEAGLSLHSALRQTAQSSPSGPLRDSLDEALGNMRAGMPRGAALKEMATRSGSAALRAWVAAMAQAEAMGMSLGPLMRGQAAQCRADRFQRAEKLAMEAPVKMLLPLIGCIFPCTFIVLGFPILWQLLPALND